MKPSLRLSFFAAFATALSLCSLEARAAETQFSYEKAVATAKEKGVDVILLADAESNTPDSSAVRRAFNSPALRKPFGDNVVWCLYEYPESTSKTFKKPDKGQAPEVSPWNLPAIMVIDPEGRVFALAEGLRSKNAAATLKKIPSLLDARKKRDALWKKASSAKDAERANLLGAGLDVMPASRAYSRKDIIDEMRKADPQDTTGYIFKYTLDGNQFHQHSVDALIKAKKTGELFALVEKQLKNPHLTIQQKQLLLTGRYQAMIQEKRYPEALDVLRSIIKLSPTSDLAIGAKEFINYYTKPVILTKRQWHTKHNRPVWLPMVVDVSDIVKTPGTYEIEFKMKTGNTRFSKTELAVGNQVIASDDNPKEQRKLRLNVSETPKGRVVLRANSLGTGWFDGTGDILITKVN